MKRRTSIGFPTATSADRGLNGFHRAGPACAIRFTIFTLVLFAVVTSLRGQDLDVPADKIPGDKPGEMMKRYWQRQAEAAVPALAGGV